MKRALAIAIVVIATVTLCALPTTALAHTGRVTPAVARVAIKADPFVVGVIDWTITKRFGVLARVSRAVCYTDPAFGLSTMVTHTLVWVHRSHHYIEADPVGQATLDSYPGGC